MAGYESGINKYAGITVTKTNTCNGNGAQTDNIFSVTGACKILELWGVCIEATNSTDLADCSFALYDSTATVEITDSAAPTDCSGMKVGWVVYRNGVGASVAAAKISNAAGAVLDVVSEDVPIIVVQKVSSAATYIQWLFNGDANTDTDIQFFCTYIPLSADGRIAAV